jgi:hypothetical protein
MSTVYKNIRWAPQVFSGGPEEEDGPEEEE